ncbi:efflux transporter periplasmic adaptor subunit [filamentous cyanobacterium CCP5]|nr:efflux transporter periplasmic adaptor subunit [filamentous cyanobacterium CCP5]
MSLMGIRPLKTALSLTVAIVIGVGCSRPQTAGPPPAVPVKLLAIQPGSFQQDSDFVGVLEAQDRVDLKPEVDGRVTRIFVAPGDPVALGQPILQLNPDQAQAQLSGAQAGVGIALSSRDAAAAQLESARAEQLQAKSDLRLAETEFGRIQSLASKGALSEQDLDQARNRVEVTTARLQQIEETIRAAESRLTQAEASLDQSQSQVAVSQEDLGFKQVNAPISGIVGDVLIKVGDYVEQGDTLTSLTQNEFLFLRLQIPSTRSGQLQIGLPVEIVDSATGVPLETGSLSFVSPEVDARAQSILVKARFPNTGDRLREGQFVRARVIWDTTTEILIPTVAVTRVAGQNFVYVVDQTTSEDGQTMDIVTQRPVQLGGIQGNSYQVLGGLEPGENIAVTNILKLRDGAPIQPETQSSNSRLEL